MSPFPRESCLKNYRSYISVFFYGKSVAMVLCAQRQIAAFDNNVNFMFYFDAAQSCLTSDNDVKNSTQTVVVDRDCKIIAARSPRALRNSTTHLLHP